jgi:hypothetical protein
MQVKVGVNLGTLSKLKTKKVFFFVDSHREGEEGGTSDNFSKNLGWNISVIYPLGIFQNIKDWIFNPCPAISQNGLNHS